jgi:hypothetical protein
MIKKQESESDGIKREVSIGLGHSQRRGNAHTLQAFEEENMLDARGHVIPIIR